LKLLISHSHFDLHHFEQQFVDSLFDWNLYDILGLLLEKEGKAIDDNVLCSIITALFSSNIRISHNSHAILIDESQIYNDLAHKIDTHLNFAENSDDQLKASIQVYFTVLILKAEPVLSNFKKILLDIDYKYLIRFLEVVYLICSRLAYDFENSHNLSFLSSNTIDYTSAILNVIYSKTEGVLDEQTHKILHEIHEYTKNKNV